MIIICCRGAGKLAGRATPVSPKVECQGLSSKLPLRGESTGNIGPLNDWGFIKTILLAGRFLRRALTLPLATLSSESSATTKNPDRN
jgi:hypothetical protein